MENLVKSTGTADASIEHLGKRADGMQVASTEASVTLLNQLDAVETRTRNTFEQIYENLNLKDILGEEPDQPPPVNARPGKLPTIPAPAVVEKTFFFKFNQEF